MLPRGRFLQGFTLGLVMLLGAAGCSTLPTQPAMSDDSALSATTTTGSSNQTLSVDGTTSTIVSATKTKTIGLLGGTVSAGDFTVVFPVGSLTRTATVTVSQPDLAHPVVNLSISPASANKFLVPVLLIGNAKRMDPALLSVACIEYYNPSTGKWERVANSSVSLLNLTVTAPLFHFSTYRVSSGGKAGW